MLNKQHRVEIFECWRLWNDVDRGWKWRLEVHYLLCRHKSSLISLLPLRKNNDRFSIVSMETKSGGLVFRDKSVTKDSLQDVCLFCGLFIFSFGFTNKSLMNFCVKYKENCEKSLQNKIASFVETSHLVNRHAVLQIHLRTHLEISWGLICHF